MKSWPFSYIMIATKNENKLKQFRDLFGQEFALTVKSILDLPHEIPDIVEDQDTFEGNAIKKAETISAAIEGPVIADDSGIVVPALEGAPGVYSARYAGEHATDLQNNEKLIEQMSTLPTAKRVAYYVCVMALAIPGQKSQVVRGECHGQVLTEHRGTGGFGYDPLFYLPEEQATMAELSPKRKYQVSHRAKATEKLIFLLKKKYQFGR